MRFLTKFYNIPEETALQLVRDGIISPHFDNWLSYYEHYTQMIEYFEKAGFKDAKTQAQYDTSFHARLSTRQVRNIIKLIESHLTD